MYEVLLKIKQLNPTNLGGFLGRFTTTSKFTPVELQQSSNLRVKVFKTTTRGRLHQNCLESPLHLQSQTYMQG